MSDLIDRNEVIEIIESVCSADDTYWQPGTLEKIRNLPTHQTPSNTLGALDCVSRQDAIGQLHQSYNLLDAEQRLEDMPSVHPDKDLIHLQKEQAYTQGYEDGQKPRRGKWIDYSDEGYVECPFCHSATNCDGNKDELHYCFSCGAELR